MSKHYNITAIIYDKRGHILSIGKNSYIKTHPLQAKFAAKAGKEKAVYLHAEIAALVKLRDWSKAHKIVVMRFNKDGEPANAKPCSICQKALREAGISNIEHT